MGSKIAEHDRKVVEEHNNQMAILRNSLFSDNDWSPRQCSLKKLERSRMLEELIEIQDSRILEQGDLLQVT